MSADYDDVLQDAIAQAKRRAYLQGIEDGRKEIAEAVAAERERHAALTQFAEAVVLMEPVGSLIRDAALQALAAIPEGTDQ